VHRELLPSTSVVVTHAGLGTVLAAPSNGVPLLCVPMGRDQFFNAAAVEQLGAGRTIGMDSDAETIRAAVASLVGDTSTKRAAERVADRVAAYGGVTEAVGELERFVSRPGERALPASAAT
jgi:UDP:flavonoid glycosyltransferase YjiC (YdhE family)